MAKGNYASTDVSTSKGLKATKAPKTASSAALSKRKSKKKLSRSVSLLSGKKLRGRKKRTTPVDPASRASARLKATEKATPLSESLSSVASSLPQGRGKIGRALKAGVAGASLGALLGESIAKAKKGRKKRAKEDLSFAKDRLGSAALDVEDAQDRIKKG